MACPWLAKPMAQRIGLSQSAAQAMATRPPRLLLIAGATGVGKSTATVGLANRLNITRVVSSDAIREIMRATSDGEQQPADD